MPAAERSPHEPDEGLRERKRRETHQRILDTALQLFSSQGYEATTLDMVADSVGIARRTFFSYFKTKDEILLAWSREQWTNLFKQVHEADPRQDPLQAVRDILDRRMAQVNVQLKSLARMAPTTPAMASTKHALFAERELLLYRELCHVWPDPARRLHLRLAAMVSIGALRIAVEEWKQRDDTTSLQASFNQAFDALADLTIPRSSGSRRKMSR